MRLHGGPHDAAKSIGGVRHKQSAAIFRQAAIEYCGNARCFRNVWYELNQVARYNCS